MNLWQHRAVASTQATPKRHLRVPACSVEALLLSKFCFKPSHGGQQASEADSSCFGGGWRQTPIMQPALLSHAFCRLPRRYPLIFSHFLPGYRALGAEITSYCLHCSWQDTSLYPGLLAATATRINQGCSLTICNGIFCYACMAPTANLGCGW